MVKVMPLDLVALVSFRRGRVIASSKAYFSTRSTPTRVKTLSCVTNSRSVPGNILPPVEEYSPSVFSLKMTMSMSPAFLPDSGDSTPG